MKMKRVLFFGLAMTWLFWGNKAGAYPCPPDIGPQANDPGVCGAIVSYNPPPGSQTAGLSSGSLFPVGKTTNTFSGGCSFVVTVVDTEPPVITCGRDKTEEVGSAWLFDVPKVTDNCSSIPPGVLVYDNASNNLYVHFDPGVLEVGDEIHLAGPDRDLQYFGFEYWWTNTAGGHVLANTGQKVRLRFYANDGPPFNGYPTPGTILYDSGDVPLPPPSLYTGYDSAVLLYDGSDFAGGLLPLLTLLPDDFTWTVQFTGLSTTPGAVDHVGVDLFSPPVVGGSYADYWQRGANGSWSLQNHQWVEINFASQAWASSDQVRLTFTTVTNWNSTNGCVYSATRTWQAIDAAGNPSSTCSQTVTVLDTTPPVIICSSNKIVEVGSAWTFDLPGATDNSVGRTLMYDNATNNLYIAFPAPTTNIGGTIGTLEIGDEIHLGGPDRLLQQFSFEYWWNNSLTGAPTNNGQVVRLRFYANDGPLFNGYATPGTVLYDSGDVTLPAAARAVLLFEAADLYDPMAPGSVPLRVALPDDFTWSVQFGGLAVGDQMGVDLYSPPVVGGSYADYWERQSDGSWKLKNHQFVEINFGAQAWASCVQVTILNTVTNWTDCTYTATRTWKATDGAGNTSTCSQTVTAVDTTPPVIACGANRTVELGSAWTFTAPTVTDNSVTKIYDNSVNNLFTHFDPGVLEVGDEIHLAGPERYLQQFGFEYFWENSQPGSPRTSPVKVRLRFYANDGPPFNGYATPGMLLYDSGYSDLPSYEREVLVYELQDLYVSALVPLAGPLPDDFTWSVQFTGLGPDDHVGVDLFSPPVVGGSFADYWERQANGSWVLKNHQWVEINFASQAWASCVTVTVLGTVTNLNSACAYTATRTWLATDGAGLSSTCSQTVTVVDRTPPVISGCPASFPANTDTGLCTAVVSWTEPTAADFCTYGWSKTHAPGETFPLGPTLVTYTATDASGNTSTCSFTVTVVDGQAPTIGAITATEVQVGSPNPVDVKNKTCNVQPVLVGTVAITAQASDSCGLAATPVVMLTNGTYWAQASFVNQSPSGTFNFTWPVDPTTPPGTWTATVTTADAANNINTATFTLCVVPIQVTGQVELEGFVGTGTTPLNTRTVTFVATTDMLSSTPLATWTVSLHNVSGAVFDFTLTGVPLNTGAISAKTDWNLRRKLPVTFINGLAGANFTGANKLLGGDLDGSNAVDLDDLVLLATYWYTSDPTADIDGSGAVDLDDLVILANNWYIQGDLE